MFSVAVVLGPSLQRLFVATLVGDLLRGRLFIAEMVCSLYFTRLCVAALVCPPPPREDSVWWKSDCFCLISIVFCGRVAVLPLGRLFLVEN